MPAKFAYAQWPWGTQSKEDFITSCRELHEVGFDAFESVKAFIDTFQDCPTEFMDICRQYNMRPISFYFHLTGDMDADLADLKKKIHFVADNGIHTICLQAAGSELPATEAQLRETVEGVLAFSEICAQYDVQPCLHPHYNTLVMRENEIDYVMSRTTSEQLGFAPDTAHLAAGGCDPLTIVRRYIDRTRFMHLKDIKGMLKGGGLQDGVEVYTNFRELGEGDIDFDPIFNCIKAANFDGYLCVELDRSRFTNQESARRSLAFLQKHW